MIKSYDKVPTSIYIHIPFCVKKCPYCDFNSYGVGTEEPSLAEPYVEAVCRELEFYFKYHWGSRELFSVFFGGGTPSLLQASQLSRILGVVRSSTDIPSGTEVTIEANPGTVQEKLGLEKLSKLVESGFNRISFGSQSFSARKLKSLGRLHSPDDIFKAVSNARLAGFERLNLDLIFGVNGETKEEYLRDIETTSKLSPEHISAYSLTIEPGTEFGKLEKKGLKFASSDDTQADLFEQTQRELSLLGFTQYEVSNYSKLKEECRHNLHYWRRGEYLGIGAGAHGFLIDDNAKWGRRWFNIPKPDHYISRVEQRLIGYHASEDLDKEQAKLEYISLGLRTKEGIEFNSYYELFDESFPERFVDSIAWGERFNLLERSEHNLSVTQKGFIMLNSVVEKFI